MYRARVEAVSGLHVRAGGKWLTCIGNRAVKAGDLVWTDGRCVYGHDRESQTPLVIAPQIESPYIPVSVLSSEPRYIFSDKLKPVDGNFDNKTELTNLKSVTTGKETVYFTWNRTTPAINVDKDENIYILDWEYYEGMIGAAQYPVIHVKKNGEKLSTVSTSDSYSTVQNATNSLLRAELYSGRYVTKPQTPRTRIIVGRRENRPFESSWMHREPNEADGTWVWIGDQAVSNYYYYELAPEWAREDTNIVMEYVDNFFYHYPASDVDEYSSQVRATLIWSFIENENNWAAIVSFRGSARITTSKETETSDPITKNIILYMTSYWIDNPIEVILDAATCYTYLFSNNGARLLSQATYLERARSSVYESPECAAVRKKAGLPPLSYGSFEGLTRFGPQTFNMSGYSELRLSMQDGFYYKINAPIDISRGDTTYPALIDITIFSPSDEVIFSGIFFSDSYLSAFRIKSNKYLLSVRTEQKATPYYDEDYNKYKELVIRRGLYLCKNGELEKIYDGKVENQCLRSGKTFKRWNGQLKKIS